MHEELDETDMGFLDFFEEIEKHKENVDKADPKGVEEARRNKDHMKGERGEGVDPIHGEWDVPEGGDMEATTKGESENGSGSENSDSEGEGESESKSEQKEKGNEEEEGDGKKSECDGDCKEGDPCPYCNARNEAQQQREQEEEDGTSEPLGQDSNGDDIYVGDEIRSKGSFTNNNSDREEYVGVARRNCFHSPFLLVTRRDHEMNVEQAPEDGNIWGWQVAHNLTTLIPKKEKKQPEDKGPVLMFVGEEGDQPVYDGDRVRVRKGCAEKEAWPEEGIMTAHVKSDPDPYGSGACYPCFTADNFEAAWAPDWWKWNGIKAWTFGIETTHNGLELYERKDEEKEKEEPEIEFEAPPEEQEHKPMTKVQQERFNNLCDRIHNKAIRVFGETKEESDIGPNLPGGVWDGEEVGRVLEIKSRGITYRISVSAERYE